MVYGIHRFHHDLVSNVVGRQCEENLEKKEEKKIVKLP